MEKIFFPTVCKVHEENGVNVEPTFKGSVTIRKPTFDEKYRYMEESGIDAEVLQQGGRAALPIIRKIVSISIPHYVSVDLTKIADGTKFESVDDMLTDGDCDSILIEVGSAILSGFKMGNG